MNVFVTLGKIMGNLALLRKEQSIHDAIKVIDSSDIQIGLVVNDNQELIGTVVDSDVRRAILANISLDESIEKILNDSPTTARDWHDQNELLDIMKTSGHRAIPILDDKNRVVNVVRLADLVQSKEQENWVIIMAGGLGDRLRPLTENLPKPLLTVGKKPIIETIIASCRSYGFRKFFISVNYMAEMIKDYFGDGSKFGVEINYLVEDKKMGTAGSLSLLPEKPSRPILVVNGDLLTKLNFQSLLDFHVQHKAHATMCVREYNLQVPFGVVDIEGQRITDINEKPEHKFLVNAGIYVLEPDVLDLIEDNSFLDMPDLFRSFAGRNFEAVAFPIREYWLDIGQLADFERAQVDFQKIF